MIKAKLKIQTDTNEVIGKLDEILKQENFSPASASVPLVPIPNLIYNKHYKFRSISNLVWLLSP